MFVSNKGDEEMLNIAICDDDLEFCGKLESILVEIEKQEKIKMSIDIYQSGEVLIKAIEAEKTCYDMIFMDIEMEGMDGLETAKRIRKKDEIVVLIYVTGYESYAIEAYEVQPFRFIVKPIDREKIYKYFMKAYEKIMAGDFYFRYKFKKSYFRVLVNDIMYFESEKRVIKIHLQDGSVRRFYEKLNNIENRMKQEKVDFYRLHKSLLVNTRYIVRKSYDHVELANGTLLDISEDKRREMGEIYVELIEGEMSD